VGRSIHRRGAPGAGRLSRRVRSRAVIDRARAAGDGALGFERSGGRTVVTRAFAASPLRLLTPRIEGEAAWAFTTSLGGGLVDGDALRLDIAVAPAALALVTTQASTKVYRSPHGCAQQTTADVGAHAALALVPDPTTCFSGARYMQSTRVRLAGGASLVFLDAVTAGRSARGERWAFDRHASRVEIEADGVPLVRDALLLDTAHGPLLPRLGRFDVLATIVVLGPRFTAASLAVLEAIERAPVARRADLIEVASPIAGSGVIVRVAATTVEEGLSRVRSRLSFLESVFGGDPWRCKR
jgi:urease accessory protein